MSLNHRLLQDDGDEDDDGDGDDDDTCELVNNHMLKKLLDGHENFVQDLLASSSRRRLQQHNTTTVLLVHSVPSVDDLKPTERHKLEIGIEGGVRRFTLTQVKTEYRIINSEESQQVNQKDSILDHSLLESNTKEDLWGAAVSGKITKDNGKKVRYQALVMGVDNSNNVTGPGGMFLYVDKRSSSKNMRRDRKRGGGPDKKGKDRNGSHVTCPRDTVMKDKCRQEIIKRHRVFENAFKLPFRDDLRAADAEVAQLDTRRFQNLYKAAADCYSTASEWNPRQMMLCVNGAKRRIFETHLIAYGALRNEILAKTSSRDLQVRRLKLARNQDLRACCKPPGDDGNDGKSRNLEVLRTKHTIPPTSTTLRPLEDVRARTTLVDQMHAERSGEQSSPPLHHQRRRGQQRRLRGLRRLQDDSKNRKGQCQIKTQIDQTELEDLVNFSRDLYRSLTSSSKKESVPADAFVTKGYNIADKQSQRLKFQKNAIRLELRQADTGEVDITNLVETSDDVPRAVSRFVRDAQFEATVVEGKQKNRKDGTEIEFVGIIFSRNDRKKQLLWPVDEGRLNGSTASTNRDRGRQLQLQEQDVTSQRDLQTVDTDNGSVICTSSQTLNAGCVADAQQAYEESRAMVRREEQEALNALKIQNGELIMSLVDRHRLAGADCAASLEEGGEGWDVTLISKCMFEDKVRDISEAVLTDDLELENARVEARLEAAQAIATLRLARDNALKGCCEENGINNGNPTLNPVPSPPTPGSTDAPVAATVAPSSDPTVMPLTNPTLMPSTNPTLMPTRNPNHAPSNRPTRSPTFAPSHGSTSAPSDKPTRSPTHVPTQGPTSGPTTGPSVQPTHSPTQSPTVSKSSSPTIVPTLSPVVLCSSSEQKVQLSPSLRSDYLVMNSVGQELQVTFYNPVQLSGVRGVAVEITAFDACGNTVMNVEPDGSFLVLQQFSNLGDVVELKIVNPTVNPTTNTAFQEIAFIPSCETPATATCTLNFEHDISGEVTLTATRSARVFGAFADIRFIFLDDVEDYVMFVPELDANGNAKDVATPGDGTISVAFGTSTSVCSVSFWYYGTPNGGSAMIQSDGATLSTTSLSTSNVGEEVSLVFADPATGCVLDPVLQLAFSGTVYIYNLVYEVQADTPNT